MLDQWHDNTCITNPSWQHISTSAISGRRFFHLLWFTRRSYHAFSYTVQTVPVHRFRPTYFILYEAEPCFLGLQVDPHISCSARRIPTLLSLLCWNLCLPSRCYPLRPCFLVNRWFHLLPHSLLSLSNRLPSFVVLCKSLQVPRNDNPILIAPLGILDDCATWLD